MQITSTQAQLVSHEANIEGTSGSPSFILGLLGVLVVINIVWNKRWW